MFRCGCSGAEHDVSEIFKPDATYSSILTTRREARHSQVQSFTGQDGAFKFIVQLEILSTMSDLVVDIT